MQLHAKIRVIICCTSTHQVREQKFPENHHPTGVIKILLWGFCEFIHKKVALFCKRLAVLVHVGMNPWIEQMPVKEAVTEH